jgi:hypothetical protein
VCGLCGSLQGGAHWSDGALSSATADTVSAWRRRAERRARIGAVNRVLSPCGLSLADWQGARFILRNRTGGAAEITGFGDLWPQADRLCATPPDPLDPGFLDDLVRRDG